MGGTNTRLAFIEAKAGGMRIIFEETFSSRERTSLESVLVEFLSFDNCDLMVLLSELPVLCGMDVARQRTSRGWSTQRSWQNNCV
ncbi:MAG: hypothetical protein WAW37_00975 [Syntrophobacteraceae bacterium]